MWYNKYVGRVYAKSRSFSGSCGFYLMLHRLRGVDLEHRQDVVDDAAHNSGAVKAVVDKLLETGACYKAEDGAIMYRSAQYAAKYGVVNKKKADDGSEEEAKDEVLVRANGIPTYFAADIAYHYNKLATRGFAILLSSPSVASRSLLSRSSSSVPI